MLIGSRSLIHHLHNSVDLGATTAIEQVLCRLGLFGIVETSCSNASRDSITSYKVFQNLNSENNGPSRCRVFQLKNRKLSILFLSSF